MLNLESLWGEASQSRLHRSLIAALARPGDVVDAVSWLGGRRAWLGILATLADGGTTLHDLHGLIDDRDWAMLGANRAGWGDAAFVLADAARSPAGDLRLDRGSLLRPETGATLVLDCAQVGSGNDHATLRGPGIDGQLSLRYAGVDAGWWRLREAHAGFPQGIDLVLCDARRIACIPRSTALVDAVAAGGGR